MRFGQVKMSIIGALFARFVLLLLIYALLRLGFYLYNLSLFPNITFTQLITIFAGGIKFDISALLYINALYILLMALPLPYRTILYIKKAVLGFLSSPTALVSPLTL